MSLYDSRSGQPVTSHDYSPHDRHDAPEPDAHSPFSDILNGVAPNNIKQTKDGQPQKRRGPKPDSKPALTRRQELNRQAQRTHRQRKEDYIKGLEAQGMKLKQAYIAASNDRDHYIRECRRLCDILQAHGIQFDMPTPPGTSSPTTMPSYNGSTNGSRSGFSRQDSNTTGFSPSPVHSRQSPQQQHPGSAVQMPSNGPDLEQLGIDFVLTLERPCAEHMQYLAVRSHNAEGQPHHHPMERADDMEHEHMCGHALMATCPPYSHIVEKPDVPYPHQMPQEMSRSGLATLLELSAQIPLEGGEVTPITAWTMIMADERTSQLNAAEFATIQALLAPKVNCYGFGAVIETCYVYDAINTVSELCVARRNDAAMDVKLDHFQPQQIMA